MKEAMQRWLKRHQTTFDIDTANSICNDLELDGEKADECIGLCYQLETEKITQDEFTGGLCVLTGKEPEEVIEILMGKKPEAVPEVTPEVITPQTPLPEGEFLRVTIKEEGKRQQSFWAKVDTRGKSANIYVPVSKEGQSFTRIERGVTIIPKDLIAHGLIVKEQIAHIDRTYGELRLGKLEPPTAEELGKPSVVEVLDEPKKD